MLPNRCKTLGFKKNMIYKIPPWASGGEVNHIQPVTYFLRYWIYFNVRREASIPMRGSRNFRRGWGGGVQVSLTKKALTTFFFSFFFVLSLFYRSQIVNFKEIYHFSRFQRGSNIFQGGGGPTFSKWGPTAYSL